MKIYDVIITFNFSFIYILKYHFFISFLSLPQQNNYSKNDGFFITYSYEGVFYIYVSEFY